MHAVREPQIVFAIVSEGRLVASSRHRYDDKVHRATLLVGHRPDEHPVRASRGRLSTRVSHDDHGHCPEENHYRSEHASTDVF